MQRDTNFYEELPAEPVADEIKPDAAKDEAAEAAKAHILSAEELEKWKNGEDAGPTLRHRAEVEAEEDDKPKEPEKPKEESKPEVPVAAANLPQVSAEDPGEYVPTDYSFEVTIYDAEGKNGKPVKVASVEQFDQLLESDSNFGSYAALAKAQRAADKMEAKAEADEAKWQAAKAEYDTQSQTVTERMGELNNIANEMNYLAAKGQLPQLSKELQEADWNDPEIAGQPGVKEWKELIAYMGRENDVRIKAGLARLTSPVSALREMQLEQLQTGQAAAATRQATSRKVAGAKVGGSAPAQATAAPKGISVGRVVAGGLREL